MIRDHSLLNNYSVPRDWSGGSLYRRKTLSEMLDPLITADAVPSLFPLFTAPAELTDMDATQASAYALQHREFLLTHVFPATTYGMGGNPTGAAAIENWNMNDLGNSMSHGWWTTESSDKWKWTHSDFKNVALLYTQELYKELVRQGKFK
jgi:hypothetical protein